MNSVQSLPHIFVCATLLVVIGGCQSASEGPVSERFINATADIACEQRKINLVYNSNTSFSPEKSAEKDKALKTLVNNISEKYGFKNEEELNKLAKNYQTEKKIIEATKQRIQQVCPK